MSTCGAEGGVNKGRGDKDISPWGLRETHGQLPPEQRRVVGQGEAPEKLPKCHKPAFSTETQVFSSYWRLEF